MNLAKGQTMNLAKGGNAPVFKLGASWGKIKTGGTPIKKRFGLFGGGSSAVREESVDLDLCTFAVDINGKIVKECSFRHETGPYMNSGGDDRGGGGRDDDDNETITLDLSKVPMDVEHIVMIINSFSGQVFDEIPFAKIRVYEGEENLPTKVHCEYNVANDATFAGAKTLVIGSLFRNGNGWDFKAIGETRTYKSIDEFRKEAEA